MNRTANLIGCIAAAIAIGVVRIWHEVPEPPPMPPIPVFQPPPAWIAELATHATLPAAPPVDRSDTNASMVRRIDERGADVAIGLGPDGAPRPVAVLSFAVTAVAVDQRPLARAPWHAAGGAWTVVETPTLELGFSVVPVALPEGSYESGEGVLRLRDRARATSLLAALGRYLRQSPPATTHALRTLHLRAGVLGRALVRNDDGSFTAGRGGTWTCMKLTIELAAPELYAEVFFSFDPVSQRGELSEKDPGFRADLMRAFGWAAGA